jgi:two-component system LytT family response regulator
MDKVTALVVDDELYGRENLTTLLSKNCPSVDVIGVVNSVKTAEKFINSYSPQIVFLDIMMPGADGFSLLEKFSNRNFIVIFVSASLEFGIKAVKAGVLDYLLKPICIPDLKTAVQRAEAILHESNRPVFSDAVKQSKIALSHSGGFTLEDIENVIRLQADDNYTNVYMKDGSRYLICRPLGDFEKSLPKEQFVRVHKTHMINIRHLKNFLNEDGGLAVLNDGYKVPVSKRKSALFIDAVKRFSVMLRS